MLLLDKYMKKTRGLCGNYGLVDNNCGSKGKCNENTVTPGFCLPNRKRFVDLCNLMSTSQVFGSCNSAVDPKGFIRDCKFDACRCDDAMDCVCSAFDTYSKDCADKGKILKWRFRKNILRPLARCGK